MKLKEGDITAHFVAPAHFVAGDKTCILADTYCRSCIHVQALTARFVAPIYYKERERKRVFIMLLIVISRYLFSVI